ncbi:hypothetical protein HXA31_04990 [Salipaludibacillus agaradhaerens]|jgi:hypothetical protein|uniref:Uncharacterized protein n=1 Tax=Salipaludibacillus agaradhaerens TaxID=76935 RepID=A0A9Q4B2C0_SALAG|nr:hypothetical protein [Salipaludibacillus agaradhaerens]MCR6096732.1 hypothetical protein [Salipaludibacillus agaradhaerens]MCR6113709.1 hypothetical protein [Salipaludibacillus agaradhaerens]
MQWIIIGLFSLSAILFLLSFFQKDSNKEIENQVENMSIQMMQEIYYLKKKIKVLEEEFLMDSHKLSEQEIAATASKALTRDDVLSLYEEGYTIAHIADMTNSHIDDIEEMMAN